MSKFSGPSALIAHLSASAANPVIAYAAGERNKAVLERALCVRAVESVLLELFAKGRLHGTVHTCIGQELTGVVLGSKLVEGDFVTSNHRGHGHFIGATGNWKGLIDEVIGNRDGVCGGIGSSQHLCSANFISNGQQGGLLPVAAGIALDRKRRATGSLVLSFIGEGTFGEGVLYETMNIAALWDLPHLIVCENNFYSQSTPQQCAIAGDLAARAAAFGIPVRESDTWNPSDLAAVADDSFAWVRTHSRPLFLLVRTYRLNSHSRGDEQRDPGEVDWFREHDPLTILLTEYESYRTYYTEISREVADYATQAFDKPKLSASAYAVDQLPRRPNTSWTRQNLVPDTARIGRQLNQFYARYLDSDARTYFIGEDIADPYGGAFKISKGLHTAHPDRVITTPISEAAITGVGMGLAIAGNRPVVEIMFGDFMTLAFDQIVNNASKFFHIYHGQVSCPLVVRAPMGGHRGYGPTHSQSLERFFVGVDNCTALSLNSLTDVARQLASLRSLKGPAIIFENKVDYTLQTYQPAEEFVLETGDAEFPTVIVKPAKSGATVTIVAYGGVARLIADNLLEIFDQTDLIPELIVPSLIYPIDLTPIIRSVEATRQLAVIEEGLSYASAGAEILASLAEVMDVRFSAVRVGGPAVPVPSPLELEEAVLPNIPRICSALRRLERA